MQSTADEECVYRQKLTTKLCDACVKHGIKLCDSAALLDEGKYFFWRAKSVSREFSTKRAGDWAALEEEATASAAEWIAGDDVVADLRMIAALNGTKGVITFKAAWLVPADSVELKLARGVSDL